MRKKSVRYNGLIGNTYGYITVLDIVYPEKGERGHAKAKVFCSACNQEALVLAPTVEQGKTKSCGCQKYINRPKGLDCKKSRNLIGQKFGKLTVLKLDEKPSRRLEWVCECECGNIKTVVGLYLVQNETTSCGCNRNRKGDDNPLYTGYKSITGKMWSTIKTGAKVRNLIFEIKIEETWDKFIEQKRKCAITNLDIKMGETASLDRINSSKGYTLDNVQWVHRDINVMKWDFDQDYFIDMCKIIVDNNKNK